MIEMQIKIENLEGLRRNFRAAPALTLKYLAKATSASISEVEKQAVDANFRFKTPRIDRSGFLAKSFSEGRTISKDGLTGSIGPRVLYAPDVYYGNKKRGMAPNKYMDRIAKAAQPAVEGHFNRAAEIIVDKLSKT